jgi:hypothetical protein
MDVASFDWNIILSALGSVLTLGGLIISTYASLSRKIQKVDSRLSHLEGAFEERGRWEVKEIKKTGT